MQDDEPIPIDENDTVDWMVEGPEVDLTKADAHKLARAAKRGFRIDITESKPGKVRGKVNKVVVEDMPAPRNPLRNLFKKRK